MGRSDIHRPFRKEPKVAEEMTWQESRELSGGGGEDRIVRRAAVFGLSGRSDFRPLRFHCLGGPSSVPCRVQRMEQSRASAAGEQKIGVRRRLSEGAVLRQLQGRPRGWRQASSASPTISSTATAAISHRLANLQNFIRPEIRSRHPDRSGEASSGGISWSTMRHPADRANTSGFGRSESRSIPMVGADDVDFGPSQGKLLDQVFAAEARVAYVMGFAGEPAQVLRAKGWTSSAPRARNTRRSPAVTATFDSPRRWGRGAGSAQPLPPRAQLDAIVMPGPEARRRGRFATRNGRGPEIKFIVGDYPADVRPADL